MSSQRPLVTLIVLNWNGRDHLEASLPSLEALRYPRDRLEVIVVDNGSTDGSVSFIRENFPRVIVVRKMRNEGYAKPNNEAAKMAGGSYIAFLNNDVRLEPDWLEKMLRPVSAKRKVVCVASKMLSWDGERVDYAGGLVNFEGRGFQKAYGEAKDGKGMDYHETLFPCSGAMLIRKDVFLEAGGFDEYLLWHYVDVDLGWRLWVLGYRVVYCPAAVCYHVHGGTSGSHPGHKKLHLLERNGILTAFKNLEDENLYRVMPASFLLQAHRALMGGEIEADRYDLESTRPLGDGEALPVKSATPLVALHAIAKALPEMMEKRKEIQERRRRTDAEIFSRFGESWAEPASGDLGAEYQKIQRELFGIFDIAGATRPEGRSARRILIVSTDYVGEEMAGPAIRCWEFARQLAPEFSVTLAIPNQTSLKPEGFRIFSYSDKNHAEFRSLAAERDVILVQGWALYHLSFLKTLRKIFIVDLYCPFPIENLNTYRYNEMGEEDRRRAHALNLIIANEQILMGDFFLCANERQRDYWLGVLSALNRLNVETFDHDTSLEKMIATVPFGIPDTAPCKGRHAIKGRVKGIGPEDKVILWAGGIFNWFDPETLIHAMDQVSRKRPDVKLFFLGTRHPNPEVPRMRVQEQAMALSKELGLHGRIVFFNEKGYVPYADRLDYLLDSDFGVSTHRRGVEARLASRTRFMDYLWSGLPIICTEGDALAEMVDREGLGLVVPAGDPDALATAILRLVEKPDEVWAIREKIERVREEFVWSRVVAPLREFCRNPSFAPDKGPERAVLPGLHRLHREKPLKEGAVREIGEKLETQDQARRRAERVADARSIQIVSSKQRETDLAGQVAKKDQQMQSLEAQLQAKRRAMSDMATHIRNIEALLQEERETTGDEGNGWLGKIRQWMGKGSAEKES